MTTIIRAGGPAHFLSLVPRMLGFRPSRSVVLVPFAGARSLGAVRLDLPRATGDGELDRVAATFIGVVCRLPDADAVAIVVYASAPLAGGDGMPHGDLVAAFADRARACGVHLTEALCVGEDGWGRYLDGDGIRPLSELVTPDAEDLDHDQWSGAELPTMDAGRREGIAQALRSLTAAMRVVTGVDGAIPADAEETARVDPLGLAAACALDDVPRLFEDALSWDAAALAPYDAATLIWCLSRPALRDIALVQWCGGPAAGDEALDAQLRWEAGEEYPAGVAMRMWGEGDRPDSTRLERALELARHVAAASPREVRAGPLATCAWLAWGLGRSTHAARHADVACDLEPEHGLAEIVRSFVRVGHLPDWAFRTR